MKAERVEKKRRKEIELVSQMIKLYCRRKHGMSASGAVCSDCQKLIDYARSRSERCPFMERKTFCSNCRVHCYSPEMRKKIREVMRYSGPRMILFHPLTSIWHMLTNLAEKIKKS